MKAIVCTYAPITKEEEELLLNTDVFKIACNWHAENIKPDLRLVLDDEKTIIKTLEAGNQKIISGNYFYDNPRVEKVNYLPNRHSTLISCLDWLYIHSYDNVLLLANNLMTNQKAINSKFQEQNKNGVNSLKDSMYIYKYSKEAYFDVPTLSIKEFLEMNDKSEFMPLTQEDILLGRTEPRKKTLLEKLAFSDSYRYELYTKGKNNKSIENGELVGSILPFEIKQQILQGKEEVEHEGLCIKRLTGIVKEEVKKPDFDNMSYNEMITYCKKNNIKLNSTKKADVLKAIKGE